LRKKSRKTSLYNQPDDDLEEDPEALHALTNE
jgi:hypothetical protein